MAPMTLSEYLDKHSLTQMEFALLSGVKQATISEICRGVKAGSGHTWRRIMEATGGAVTPLSLENSG